MIVGSFSPAPASGCRRFGDGLMTFDLAVDGLTPPWDVVSQGRRTHHDVDREGLRSTSWSLDHPTEEIYLVAGPWHEYSRDSRRCRGLCLSSR